MDIKLMNHGRGAGKTHTLLKWAKSDEDRRVIITARTDTLRGKLRPGNFWTYGTMTKEFIERVTRPNNEVAFDDFDLSDTAHVHLLMGILATGRTKSVILATNHETMQTDASRELNQKFGLGAIVEDPKKRPYTIPEAPGLLFTRETPSKITFRAAEAEEDDKIKMEAADKAAAKYKAHCIGHLSDEQCAEMEPIQKTKARDLRLGDWIVGKGAVTGIYLSSLPQEKGQLRILIEDKEWAFDGGNLVVNPKTLLDVDTTKRK